jgi:hypothetical protein
LVASDKSMAASERLTFTLTFLREQRSIRYTTTTNVVPDMLYELIAVVSIYSIPPFSALELIAPCRSGLATLPRSKSALHHLLRRTNKTHTNQTIGLLALQARSSSTLGARFAASGTGGFSASRRRRASIRRCTKMATTSL